MRICFLFFTILLLTSCILIFEKKEAKALFTANCWTKNAKGITCWLSDLTPKKAMDSAMKKAGKHCRNHKKISSVLYHKGNRVKFSCLTKEQYREKLATGIDPYAGEKNKSEKVDDFGKKYKKPMEQIIKSKKERDRAKKEAKKIEELNKKTEEMNKDNETLRGATCKLSEDITPANFCIYKCSDGTKHTRPADRGPVIARYPNGIVIHEYECREKIKLRPRIPKPR